MSATKQLGTQCLPTVKGGGPSKHTAGPTVPAARALCAFIAEIYHWAASDGKHTCAGIVNRDPWQCLQQDLDYIQRKLASRVRPQEVEAAAYG